MAISEERALENTIVTQVAALTYINANSVTVLNHDDNSADRVFPCVVCRVSPRERIAPSADYYKLPVEIIVCRHRGDDPNQAVADQIYNDVADYANGLTADGTIATTDGGIVHGPGIEEFEDKVHVRGVSFEVYTTI